MQSAPVEIQSLSLSGFAHASGLLEHTTAAVGLPAPGRVTRMFGSLLPSAPNPLAKRLDAVAPEVEACWLACPCPCRFPWLSTGSAETTAALIASRSPATTKPRTNIITTFTPHLRNARTLIYEQPVRRWGPQTLIGSAQRRAH